VGYLPRGAFKQEAAVQLTPATLSPAQIERFGRDGYVTVEGAFSHDDAQAMQNEWWSELAEVYGLRREDRSTWHQPVRDLRCAKQSSIQERIATTRVQGVIDDLLGPETWPLPPNWGRVLTTFPQPGTWNVPTKLWHWDSPLDWHRNALNGLFVASFIGSVAPRSGGTLILSGSHRLLGQQEAILARDNWNGDARARRELFHRSHPWLMALTGKASSPVDRVAAFMDKETLVNGVPLRVVELTGEPGDMVLCHPTIVHSASPNCGASPRFMRIAGILTHDGMKVRSG
jgi:phytanoyl-CoA dioxygenase PhyH